MDCYFPVRHEISQTTLGNVIESCLIKKVSPEESITNNFYITVVEEDFGEIYLKLIVFLSLLVSHDRSSIGILSN